MLKTKIKLSILLLMFLSMQFIAQDISLNKSGEMNKFYLEKVGRLTGIDCDAALLSSLRAGYNLDQNISIGLTGGLLLSNEGESFVNNKRDNKIDYYFGGAEGIYKCNLSDRFYVASAIAVGVAKVEFQDVKGDDWFGIIEPRMSINYRIADCFGIGYSIDYRFATGVKFGDFSNNDFSSLGTSLSLKIGF